MRTQRITDSPWRRLPWTLPGALVVWAMVLWSLAFFIKQSGNPSVAQLPIDARIIEQNVPISKDVRLGQRGAVKNPKPASRPAQPPPALQARPMPVEIRRYRREALRPTRKVEVKPGANEEAPAAVAHGRTAAMPVDGHGSLAKSSADSGVQAGSPSGNSASGGMDANSSARAIIRPMPQIPDDLREQVFSSSVLARFHIAADGNASVELAKPTPNLRLNSIVLASLKKWRFMPAIKNGSPVASTEEIVIKIEVK